jgi:hypothetical protein
VKVNKKTVKSVNLFDANLFNGIYLSFINFSDYVRHKIQIFRLSIKKMKDQFLLREVRPSV